MLTIQLYGLAEHPKTQLLKVSLLDALVELPVAFSFVQISTLDAFLEQELPEIPCLMVNGGLVPAESTRTIEQLSNMLATVAKSAPEPTEKNLLPPVAEPAQSSANRPRWLSHRVEKADYESDLIPPTKTPDTDSTEPPEETRLAG